MRKARPRPGSPPSKVSLKPGPDAVPSAAEVLDELHRLGRASYKGVLVRNHGVREPCDGVPISELQKLRRRLQGCHALALALYDSGHYDAMYLAGLIADDARMTRADLQRWVQGAYGGCLHGTTVPSVAAGSPVGLALALEWLDSPKPLIAAAGWATLSCIVSVRPDDQLDLPLLARLLDRVRSTLPASPDAVRYQMNNFVIAVACYVTPLTEAATRTATALGTVTADLGPNACRVPEALTVIRKVRERGTLGRKRKSAKC